jgi:5-methylcytosine-specific restriction endonuclease McrA
MQQKIPSGKFPPRWRRISQATLIRDAYMCHICGLEGADTADHIIPRSKGGSHDMYNLRAAHRVCNSRKGNHIIPSKPRISRYG